MRWLAGCAVSILVVSGCAAKKSSLLLDRQARGPLTEMRLVAKHINWELELATQTQEQGKVEVTVNFASQEYLRQFFGNRSVFGEYAGPNPYFPENIIFYVKITNRSAQRIRISPWDFVLVDDRGNQYSPLDVDYVNALADARRPVSTITRGLIEDARPGYFGLSLPIGKIVATKPQGRLALIKQCTLQTGYLYPGVIHDGLVVFWSPTNQTTSMRLLVTNIKTDFDANELPKQALEFPFTFHVKNR